MTAGDRQWRVWLAVFFATALVTAAMLSAALLVLDPYGTGRLTPIQRTDIATDQHAFANAARVRDPRFNAAIIGNSRAMRIAPYQLDAMTGRSFVSLAVPGVGPLEQVSIAAAFVRNHDEREITLVWGLGDEWCRSHYEPLPFPQWLYDRSHVGYLANLLKPSTIRLAIRRAQIMLGLSPPAAPADGYERLHPYWLRQPDVAAVRAINAPAFGEAPDMPTPYIDRLADLIRSLGDDDHALLLFPPIFANTIPPAGSSAERRMLACKLSVKEIAANRPNIQFLDMQQATPTTRDPSNFLDAVHYIDSVARVVEQAIAATLISQ